MEVGVETWRVFKHGEGSILFPDEQLAPTLENLASRIQILRAPPPPSFNPLFPPLLLNQLYRARILMENYISVENIIFYFRFVLEKKKSCLQCCEESKNLANYLTGGKALDSELNSEFFSFHSVTFRGKYFSIFVFAPRTSSSCEDRKI